MTHSSEPFFKWPGWPHLRFAWLLSGITLLWFVIVYGGSDALTAHRTLRIRVHLDAELAIPFVPEMVVIYMSIYLLFLAVPFILRRCEEILALAMTLNLVVLVGGIGFLLFPAELAYAVPKNIGYLPGMFRLADALNLTYNLMPSLHVALSVVCIGAFALRIAGIGKVLLWSWAIAIAASTLLTHQHHLLDVLTGFGLGVAGLRLVYLKRANFSKDQNSTTFFTM
ncbi:phosphatase PAP2 family protein [Pedosphaera parvula]|uniref:Phosphoesterase PA-phosphatase related protein n=1 Tax=Pedosphaera parvula (strain Ellin514) TaxID=320771 RepID=B9XDY8_PEDPL|nr:phosphatase PAP2 family protein [Pedosphaera parvula]EEF61879.1 phosphoesterase PA-phosphatase related protein [Pedosphaera parvula Ellin514]